MRGGRRDTVDNYTLGILQNNLMVEIKIA